MRLILLTVLLTLSARAAVFTVDGENVLFTKGDYAISELVKDFAGLNRMNVVFSSDFRDSKVSMVGPLRISKQALPLYLSTMLAESGYMTRTLPETSTMNVFSSRDVRYMVGDPYTDLSKVPKTYEPVQFMYELKYMDSHELARNLRPFVSRYGRVIDHTNSILLSDTGRSVWRIMQVIQELDVQDYVKSAEEVKVLNEKNKKVIKKKRDFLEIIGSNNVLFILLFTLVGLVIGFGVRGYTMKRIEGGW